MRTGGASAILANSLRQELFAALDKVTILASHSRGYSVNRSHELPRLHLPPRLPLREKGAAAPGWVGHSGISVRFQNGTTQSGGSRRRLWHGLEGAGAAVQPAPGLVRI